MTRTLPLSLTFLLIALAPSAHAQQSGSASLNDLSNAIQAALDDTPAAPNADEVYHLTGPADFIAPKQPATPAAPAQSGVHPLLSPGFDGTVSLPPADTRPVVKIPIGTVATATLDMTANSDHPGPFRGKLTAPIVSIDHSLVVAPAGSIIVGNAARATGQNEVLYNRMTLIPTAIIRPDGTAISLNGQFVTDQEGVGGVGDKVDFHLDVIAAAAGGSTLLDVLPDVIRDVLGVDDNDGDILNVGTQEAETILGKYLDVLPTIETRPGTPFQLFFMREVVTPAWRSAEPYRFTTVNINAPLP
jgi:hypothetical protein